MIKYDGLLWHDTMGKNVWTRLYLQSEISNMIAVFGLQVDEEHPLYFDDNCPMWQRIRQEGEEEHGKAES